MAAAAVAPGHEVSTRRSSALSSSAEVTTGVRIITAAASVTLRRESMRWIRVRRQVDGPTRGRTRATSHLPVALSDNMSSSPLQFPPELRKRPRVPLDRGTPPRRGHRSSVLARCGSGVNTTRPQGDRKRSVSIIVCNAFTEIVVPLHMRQLVSQHGIEMCGWQPGDHADREQDYRGAANRRPSARTTSGCKNVDRSADAKTLREDTQPRMRPRPRRASRASRSTPMHAAIRRIESRTTPRRQMPTAMGKQAIDGDNRRGADGWTHR